MRGYGEDLGVRLFRRFFTGAFYFFMDWKEEPVYFDYGGYDERGVFHACQSHEFPFFSVVLANEGVIAANFWFSKRFSHELPHFGEFVLPLGVVFAFDVRVWVDNCESFVVVHVYVTGHASVFTWDPYLGGGDRSEFIVGA